MKLDVLNDSLSTTDVSKMSVNVDNLTYSLMIDGIYTNKLSSVVRELSTNARDSHISANNSDPFLITLRYQENSQEILLSIKDFGLGLSEEDAKTFLCNLNASNKRESDESIGCFGIGSKSPFSLVDSYDFNCIKDGILTKLNLFRIKSETPRFLISTEQTTEKDSVECLVRLDSYNLETLLETIYVELALFDIKPKIHIISESLDFIIEPEEFFCTLEEANNFYHLFYKEPTDDLNLIAPNFKDKVSKYFQSLKNTKKISCGIIGYNSTQIENTYQYGYNDYSEVLSDFYILKFELDSGIKFDVSRENIVTDASTLSMLNNKVLSDFYSISTEEAIKLKTLYIIISSFNGVSVNYPKSHLQSILPDFYTDLETNLFITPPNQTTTHPYKTVNYNYLFSKFEESFNYYRNNLDELRILSFVCKTKVKARTLNFQSENVEDLSLSYMLASYSRSNISLNNLSILEKMITNRTTIWEEIYLKNIIPTSSFSFLGQFFQQMFLGIDRYSPGVNAKYFLFNSSHIKNLDEMTFDIVLNYKRLKSATNLHSIQNQYKNNNSLEDKLVLILSSTRSNIVEKELELNLQSLSSKPVFSIYDSLTYLEENKSFIETVKYTAAQRPRASTVSRPSVSNGVVATHNEFGVKLRNKLLINACKSHTLSTGDQFSFDSETTSLKLYNILFKRFENYNSFLSSFIVLVSKDIIKTREEKLATLVALKELRFDFIFEIDNLEYYDQIKDVCKSVLINGPFRFNKVPIIELNTNFSEEDVLKNYFRILLWIYTKNKNYESYVKILRSIAEDDDSILLSSSTEEEGAVLRNLKLYDKPSFIEDSVIIRKVNTFLKKLNLSISQPYSNANYYVEPKNIYISEVEDFKFKGLSCLLDESLSVDKILPLTDNQFSENSIISHYSNNDNSSKFFNKASDIKNATTDSLLVANDSLILKRIFNQDFLKHIEDNYNDSLISFNEEYLKNLLKEY